MENPILNLAAINTITDPNRAIILETIGKRKHVSFKELRDVTKLSNDGLTKQLEKLQKYSLIKGELSDPKGGSYSFYSLTNLGQTFRNLLHDFLTKSNDVQPDPISNKFVIDFESLKTILDEKNLDYLKQLFKECQIVLTNRDFVEITKFVDNTENTELESYINNEDKIILSEVYQDEESAVKREYYLKRIKKLTPSEARLVATATDVNASVISNNKKILSASRGFGLMCAQPSAIMELGKQELLTNKFYELSLKKSDSKNMDLPLQNNPLTILKKN